MSFTPQNLCGFLIRSRLMTPDAMRAMFERWQADAAGAAADSDQFSKWLVARQYVTEYQASLLSKGHGDPDSFFLGQYKITERLGRGRMAGVYKAVHELGQTVAIKVLPPSKAKDANILGRFQREARLALRLKHPNVVRTFQVGNTNDLHYMVMEYLDGETLDEVLRRRGRLPPAEAVRLIHQALAGLEHIHERGMVHRDLKPANLMLVRTAGGAGGQGTTLGSTLKILDIGLGRNMFADEGPPGDEKVELTGEGMILGTPDYLAPEQARDPRAIDIRADIYSVGCVLYQMLSGRPPFPDANLINQMVRHATEDPKPLAEENPDVPEGLQQIIGFMMAKRPDKRYATPKRAAQALEVFLLAEVGPKPIREDGPRMRKYLTWLESVPSEPPTDVPVRGERVPVTQPVTRPAQRSRRTPAPRAASASREPKNHQPRHAGVPIARPAPAAAIQEFDVELVPAPAGAAILSSAPPNHGAVGPGRGWWLVGAVGVLLAVIFAIVLFVSH